MHRQLTTGWILFMNPPQTLRLRLRVFHLVTSHLRTQNGAVA